LVSTFRATLTAFALAIGTVATAAPVTIHHQGRILTGQGEPVDGAVALTVRLYSAATGGSLLYEQVTTTPVARGFFTTALTPDDAALLGDA
jgi:hypothetical protein